MMDKFKAVPLDELLEDVSGNATQFREKFQKIYYIYSKQLTADNCKKLFQAPERESDYEVFEEVNEAGESVKGGVMFYWDTPIMTNPRTIGQFITVATALNRELYWKEEVYRDYVYVNAKY